MSQQQLVEKLLSAWSWLNKWILLHVPPRAKRALWTMFGNASWLSSFPVEPRAGYSYLIFCNNLQLHRDIVGFDLSGWLPNSLNPQLTLCASCQPASGRGDIVSACAGLINQLQSCRLDHRVDSVIESSLRSKIMHWIIWAETFVRWRWMLTKQFLNIWLLSVNILNFKEILLIFLILRLSRVNEVRLHNLYLALCKHSL